MEIWQQIEILRKSNKTWFFPKDRTEEKISALSIIANKGYPSLICSLVEFLKDDHKEIRESTCRTIIRLFHRINGKRAYYDTLKPCSISKRDIDFYEANFSREQYVELLGISSLNGNGYIREKAVKKLAEVDCVRAIPFLIYRLADWVQPIRQSAENGIKNYKTTSYIDSIVENLPIFEWLQEVEHTDLRRIYQDYMEFVATHNREYVIENFKKYRDKVRILLAKQVSGSLRNGNQELQLLLTDKHFLIRSLALVHFERLAETDIESLLKDKSAKIRLGTLHCMKGDIGFKAVAKKFIADTSGTIRQYARFTLKEFNIDFAKFYNDNLLENKQVIGSLNGLSETEGGQYSDTVKSYLQDNRIRVRKTAFVTLSKLDQDSAYNFAIANLDSRYIGLRNVIIEFLSHMPVHKSLLKARSIYKSGNTDLKKSMLNFFSKVGGWAAISDLMFATIDDDEIIRQLAVSYLELWRTRAVRLFTSPKPLEIERAREIFAFVNIVHKEKRYFETIPVTGLDFYFR